MSEDALDFDLWLEWETGDPDQPANRPHENFGNISITQRDGRRFVLNVWTFDFLVLYQNTAGPKHERF